MAEDGSLGKRITQALRQVLRRCEEAGEKIVFKGEGGERPFRKWLATDVLEAVLGWPSKNVMIGERFDVLLLSDEDLNDSQPRLSSAILELRHVGPADPRDLCEIGLAPSACLPQLP